MTRINVVPVEELSDQWLIAEYRELPRVIKQKIDISDAPEKYCLGKGHMKWARKHWRFIFDRLYYIKEEMKNRGFKPNFDVEGLFKYGKKIPVSLEDCWYFPTTIDFKLNQQRLIEKYKLKPDWYRWTNRNKPKWLEV